MTERAPEGGMKETKDALRGLKAWSARQHVVVWFLAGFALLVVAGAFSQDKPAMPVPASPDAAKVDAEAARAARQAAAVSKEAAEMVKGCNAILADLEKLGTIRERPAPNRVDIDERLWAELPYRQKEALLSLVSCSAFGQSVPPEGKHVAAYGWRDGQRKLVWDSTGSF